MCISRPRRFGKSMAADMLVAYYSRGSDSREVFRGLKVEKLDSFEKHLNKHNVIRIDVQQFLETEKDLEHLISEIEQRVIKDLRREFSTCSGYESGSRFKVIGKVIKQHERVIEKYRK